MGNGKAKAIGLLIVAVLVAVFVIWWKSWKMPKIIVGAKAAKEDFDAAKYIRLRSWKWVGARIYDDYLPITDANRKDPYLVVGAWNANLFSKHLNDLVFHLTATEDAIYAGSTNLGKYVIAESLNSTIIWGLNKEDTLEAAKQYVAGKRTQFPANHVTPLA